MKIYNPFYGIGAVIAALVVPGALAATPSRVGGALLFTGMAVVFGLKAIKAPESIICPNARCGYEGPVKLVPRGSVLVAFVLFCFFVLPGVLYVAICGGYSRRCPKCKMQLGTDN